MSSIVFLPVALCWWAKIITTTTTTSTRASEEAAAADGGLVRSCSGDGVDGEQLSASLERGVACSGVALTDRSGVNGGV